MWFGTRTRGPSLGPRRKEDHSGASVPTISAPLPPPPPVEPAVADLAESQRQAYARTLNHALATTTSWIGDPILSQSVPQLEDRIKFIRDVLNTARPLKAQLHILTKSWSSKAQQFKNIGVNIRHHPGLTTMA